MPTPEVPGTGGFYRVDTFEDSLAAGAAALFRVTADGSYLDDAMRYLRATGAAPLDYGNFAPLAAADICGRLGAPPLGDAATTDEACRSLTKSPARRTTARANAFAPASEFTWGMTAISSAAGAFASMAGGSSRALGAGARDYLLGRDPWGASFVTGFGPHSPKRVHHWASVLGIGTRRVPWSVAQHH